MYKIKTELTKIIEKYKKEYSSAFDRNGTDNALGNNVMLIAKILPKISQELVDAKNSYCTYNNITDTTKIDEIKNDLYMNFVDFSTTFRG